MRRTRLGKFILSFVLVVGAAVSTAVDWNTTPLFNPAWHPHARFRDGTAGTLANPFCDQEQMEQSSGRQG